MAFTDTFISHVFFPAVVINGIIRTSRLKKILEMVEVMLGLFELTFCFGALLCSKWALPILGHK